MEELVVKLIDTEEERRAAFDVRMRVFVQEQGVPAEEELDEDDTLPLPVDRAHGKAADYSNQHNQPGNGASHAIAFLGGMAVGTGRLVYAESGEGRIGRMAVEKAWRRRGIGSRILRSLEDEARRRGKVEAVLHAQSYVKCFYADHGYVEEGDTFLEVGIEHVQMRKRL